MALPNSTRKPGVYVDQNVSNAQQGLVAVTDSICIIAQRLSTGSIAAKTPTMCFSDADAALYYGSGSVAHLATRAFFQKNASSSGVTVVGVDDAGAAVDATGTIAFTTPPTAGGVVYAYVGDITLQAAYSSSDTSVSVVNTLCADASNYTSILPVTVSKTTSTGTLKFVAKNKGTVGNKISVAAYDTNGSSWYTVTDMASGATDPDVGNYSDASTVLASIVSGGYTIYVNAMPNTNADHGSATKIKTMVDFVSSQTEQRRAIQVMAMTDLNDTYSNIETMNRSINHGRTTCAYLPAATTNGPCSEFFKIAAEYAADIATQSDTPALSYNYDVLTTIAPPAIADRLTRTQQEDLLINGTAPLMVTNEQVAIVKAITTYVTNSAGNADTTLLSINTYRTLDYVAKQVFNALQVFNKSSVTTRVLKAIKTIIYLTLKDIESAEQIQNVDYYKDAITVVVNATNPSRVDVHIPTNIVSPLDIVAAELDLIIS